MSKNGYIEAARATASDIARLAEHNRQAQPGATGDPISLARAYLAAYDVMLKEAKIVNVNAFFAAAQALKEAL